MVRTVFQLIGGWLSWLPDDRREGDGGALTPLGSVAGAPRRGDDEVRIVARPSMEEADIESWGGCARGGGLEAIAPTTAAPEGSATVAL